MNQDAIKEIAKQLGVGANYLAEHLTEFAPQWSMFKAIQDLAVVLLMGFILAVLAFVMRKAMKEEGDEAFGCDKTSVVNMLAIFGFAALVLFGCFAVDAIMHLAVPQVAMINDMLEMVQQ
jgi:preprotein translocase subunit SecE